MKKLLIALVVLWALGILWAGIASATDYDLCATAHPDGIHDSRAAVVTGLAAVAGTANAMTVTCPVYIQIGYDITKPVFIDSTTTITFTGDPNHGGGKFIVDNILVPALEISGSQHVHFNNMVLEYIGDYGDVAIDVTSGPAVNAANHFNDITLTAWQAAHRSITFAGGFHATWAGPTNMSALIDIRGDATDINFPGFRQTIAPGANVAHFAPTVFSIATDWNHGVTTSTPTLANTSIPSAISLTNCSFDGNYMGIVGLVNGLTFSHCVAYRYADLQTSSGGSIGGVGMWFAPPHLVYLKTGGGLNYHSNINATYVTDYGTYTGNPIRRSAGSGSLLSLKVEAGNGSVIDHYTSFRPDGITDIVTNGNSGFTMTNILGVLDSSVHDATGTTFWGVRFPGPTVANTLTFAHWQVIDTAAVPGYFIFKGMGAGNVSINFSDINLFQHAKVGQFPSYPGTGISVGMTITYDTCLGGRPPGGTNDPGTVIGC
jgi:hypothetical protein